MKETFKETYLPLIILFIFLVGYFLLLISSSKVVVNYDTVAHFYFSYVLNKAFENHLFFPSLNLFNGLAYYTGYPSLCYYFFPLIKLLFSDITLAWNIYLFLVVVGIALASFYLAKRLDLPSFYALIFGILVILFRNYTCCSEFGASNIFGIGVLPFSFSFIWFPLFLGNVISNLETSFDSGKWWKYALGGFLGALVFYSHYYTFLIVEMIIAMYFLFGLSKNNLSSRFKSFILIHCFLLIFISPGLLVNLVNSSDLLNDAAPLALEPILKRAPLLFQKASGESLDYKLPFVAIWSIIFLALAGLSVLFKKIKSDFFSDNQKIIALGLSFAAVFIIFALLLPFSKIKLPYEFVYAHLYGRFLAFVKYFFLLFFVLGWYFFFHWLFKNKTSKFYSNFSYGLLVFVVSVFYIYPSLEYLNINYIDSPQEKKIMKDLKSISEHLNSFSSNEKSNLLVSPSADIYYEKFFLPYYSNVDFIPQIGAWWPSWKKRNFHHYIFDAYSMANPQLLDNLFNDFNVNYLLVRKEETSREDLKQLSEVVEEGDILALLKTKKFYPKIETINSVVILVDDKLYVKDFTAALNLYKNTLFNKNYKIILVTPKQLLSQAANLQKMSPFVKGIVIRDVSPQNCKYISEFLEKGGSNFSNIIYQVQSVNNVCNLSLKSFQEQEIAQLTATDKDIILYYQINDWQYYIYPNQLKPIIVKVNYDYNWKAVQGDKIISSFFILPSHLLIMPENLETISLSYTNDSFIIKGVIIAILVFLTLIGFLVLRARRQKRKSEYLNND